MVRNHKTMQHQIQKRRQWCGTIRQCSVRSKRGGNGAEPLDNAASDPKYGGNGAEPQDNAASDPKEGAMVRNHKTMQRQIQKWGQWGGTARECSVGSRGGNMGGILRLDPLAPGSRVLN